MAETTLSQIMELKEKSLGELKAKYEELFIGQKAPSNNKVYLWRKIAYRMQELEYDSIPTVGDHDNGTKSNHGGSLVSVQ